jgi:hypothetical protein
MKTVDISQMGNILNMGNIFSLYVEQICSSPDKTAQNRISKIRKDILNDIRHFSYAEINTLMRDLILRTSRYNVLTRNDLEKSLEKASVYQVLVAAALIEDEGQHEAMLYLLHPVKSGYKGKDLLMRFGFIDNPEKK